MIEFRNKGLLVEAVDELPEVRDFDTVYVDMETTSGDKKKAAFDPYHDSRILGIAFTADNLKPAWYVPLRHHSEGVNIPYESGMNWLRDVLTKCKVWANNNVKFDAHFAACEGVQFDCELHCLTTMAKIINSDRGFGRGDYTLTSLSQDWLKHDVSGYEKGVKAHLRGAKSKDYGDVPADIMGEYACEDVFTARGLYRYMKKMLPEQCKGVWETESKLTPVLFDVERGGMGVNKRELQIKQLLLLNELILAEQKIHDLAEMDIKPSTPSDCRRLLCDKFGLPILSWTEKGEPSFSADALKSYLQHPDVVANPKLMKLIKLIMNYKKRDTVLNIFVTPYLRHEAAGVMHPNYNQCVRTGRLSCKAPNSQNLNKEAKALIHPDEGCAFLSSDWSQIEFRIIVHYIKNEMAIAAYNADPDTDFHTWVAEMCQIDRSPAKNVNFAMGFGGGKKRVLLMLRSNLKIIEEISKRIANRIAKGTLSPEQAGEAFTTLVQRRTEEVYKKYHGTLPTLKTTSKRAELSCKRKGYVFNLSGRRRHLPPDKAWLAFNALCQSSAADIMKERMVALAPRYNPWMRKRNITLRGSVHDEMLFHGPRDIIYDPETVRYVANMMENPKVTCKVPMRVSIGLSDKNWAEASGDAGAIERSYFECCSN